MGSNSSTSSAGRGEGEGDGEDLPPHYHEFADDSEDSMDDESDAAIPPGSGGPRSAEDLISVFQVLIRNGQIHIVSSGEDSDTESRFTEYRIPKPPKCEYVSDVAQIQKNDLNVTLRKEVGLNSTLKKNLPNLLCARELGTASSASLTSGFDKAHRNLISTNFLPNSVRKVANYGHKAFCGTYSKSGDIFLSAAQDRLMRVYDSSNDRFKEFKKIHCRDVGWSVLDTAFSPDGQHMVYSSWSESIHICNVYGDHENHEALNLCPESRRFCIFSVVFSEDGNEILGGANDGYLYIYDRTASQRVLKINAHEDDVNSVSFADETSHILFSAADDGLCKVWDRRTLNESRPHPVGIFAGHIDGITFIDSKSDGRYLVTNSKDQSIKLWDMRVFSGNETVNSTKKAVADQTWDYRWQRVPKKLCVPRSPIEGDTSIMTYRGHSVLNTLIRCRFSPSFSTGQRYIYTGCAAGRVVIYDVLTGKIEKVLKGHRSCVRDVSWHPYKPELVSTSWDNTIGLWTYIGRHALDSVEERVLGIEPDNDRPPKRQNLRRSSRLAQKQSRSANPNSTNESNDNNDDDQTPA